MATKSKSKAAPKRKMTMSQYEKSPADKRADKAEAKRGLKEGSPAEKAADRSQLAKLNKGRK